MKSSNEILYLQICSSYMTRVHAFKLDEGFRKNWNYKKIKMLEVFKSYWPAGSQFCKHFLYLTSYYINLGIYKQKINK